MDADTYGVKECLSVDAAESQWTHSRVGNEVECLKIYVEPEGGAWDPHGENYCYHELSSGQMTMQVLNTAAWMTIEWGLTLAAGTLGSPATGAAVKPVAGMLCGAGEELSSQYLSESAVQTWPGHPN